MTSPAANKAKLNNDLKWLMIRCSSFAGFGFIVTLVSSTFLVQGLLGPAMTFWVATGLVFNAVCAMIGVCALIIGTVLLFTVARMWFDFNERMGTRS